MATYQIAVPEQMNCSGDLPTNWKIFREAYKDYLVATGLNEKEKKIQVATLKSFNHGQKCWDSYTVRTLFNTREIVAARY